MRSSCRQAWTQTLTPPAPMATGLGLTSAGRFRELEVIADVTGGFRNSKLAFPTVSNDSFVLSIAQTNAIVTQVTSGSTNSSLSSALNSFFDRYERSLIASRWLYCIIRRSPWSGPC